MMEGSGAGSEQDPYRTCDQRIRMRIREAQKHTDPSDADPDPQH